MWLEGGQGARAYADGNSFYMMIFIGGASNQPNETLERWYPMVYTSTEAVVDSCGDGEFRGGFGIWRSFRATGDTELVVLGDRERVGPFGLAGGTNGGPNMVILNPGTDDEENLGMFTTKAKLKTGDQLEFGSNGGGGFGLPWERKVESVLEDVIDGLLSIDKARDVYGVAITEMDADALVYEVDDDGDREPAREARQGRAPTRGRALRGQPARRGALPRPGRARHTRCAGGRHNGARLRWPRRPSTPRGCRRRSVRTRTRSPPASGRMVFVAGQVAYDAEGKSWARGTSRRRPGR